MLSSLICLEAMAGSLAIHNDFVEYFLSVSYLQSFIPKKMLISFLRKQYVGIRYGGNSVLLVRFISTKHPTNLEEIE